MPIKGNCYTNLDDYVRYTWPNIFVTVPKIGDYVTDVSNKKELKVVRITHRVVRTKLAPDVPYIEVELNK